MNDFGGEGKYICLKTIDLRDLYGASAGIKSPGFKCAVTDVLAQQVGGNKW